MTVFTEEEAKGKVCPMKLSQKETMASRSHCLGSKCMWWKWRELLSWSAFKWTCLISRKRKKWAIAGE